MINNFTSCEIYFVKLERLEKEEQHEKKTDFGMSLVHGYGGNNDTTDSYGSDSRCIPE